MRSSLLLALLFGVFSCGTLERGTGAAPAGTPPVKSGAGSAVRDAASALVLCKTTETELRAALGVPFRDGRVGGNRIVSWVAETNPERFLAVLLDARGVAVDVYWDAPGAIAWSPSDHCAGAAAAPPSSSAP